MILATRTGNRELRTLNPADFGVTVPGPGEVATVAVSPRTVAGIPAVTQIARMAAEQVASTDFGVWRGKGVDRRAVPGSWQAKFFDGRPNDQQTTFGFWETVEESLTLRSNAYVWLNVDPRTKRVVEWYALHPDQVGVFAPRQFRVLTGYPWIDPTGRGSASYTVGEDVLLHIRGFGDGGRLIAPSPIQRERDALKVAIAKIRHEGKLYDNSANPSFILSFPGELTQEQMDDYRESMQLMYGGGENAGRIGVVGSGATVSKVGLTMADAQFIQSMQFDVEQCSRIFNWEVSLLGAGPSSAGRSSSGPLTPEHELNRLLRYRMVPRFKRIESAVFTCPALFAAGSLEYPMFNTDRALRGDLQTESDISQKKVQSGQWTPNEARALDGMGPLGYLVTLPDGSQIDAGDIPQLTPVGGAPNPEPPPAEG